MHPAFTYTLLALCVAVFALGIWSEGRKDGARGARLRRFSLAMQLGALASAYLVLRPGRGDDAQRAMQLSASARRPLLMDIYSNW